MKVLMLGGCGSGKTSVLASMFDQMIFGQTASIIPCADVTKYPQNETNSGKRLRNFALELQYFLHKNPSDNIFRFERKPDYVLWEYQLYMKISGNRIQLSFIDIPGSLFDSKYSLSEITELVKNADIFIVTIDTPYLMEGHEYENELKNKVHEIHGYLSLIHEKSPYISKQVIFVPVKCEKWMDSKKTPDKPEIVTIEDVIEKVKDTYKNAISDLCTNGRTEISIIPVATMGCFVFSEFKDSYLLVDTSTNNKIQCAKQDDHVIDKYGRIIKLKENHILIEDSSDCIPGMKQKCRSEWFKLHKGAENTPCFFNKKVSYSPQNGDQLALHILRFALSKAEEEYKGDLIRPIDYSGLIRLLKSSNLIKDNCECIKTINNCYNYAKQR